MYWMFKNTHGNILDVYFLKAKFQERFQIRKKIPRILSFVLI